MNTGGLMYTAAQALLAALTPDLQSKAVLPFDCEERFHWAYFPVERRGVALGELRPAQRLLAHALISTGYSPEGAMKAAMIMSLDEVLWEQELDLARDLARQLPPMPRHFFLVSGLERLWRAARDPESYYITFFGEPSLEQTWGWRLEGHHLSLNATILHGEKLVLSPTFFGANPATIKQGPRGGLRVLAAEEDLARQLVLSLNARQRERAVISEQPPVDILTQAQRRVRPFDEPGVTADTLDGEQRGRLQALLETYTAALPADVAAARLSQIEAASAGGLRFAWAGGTAAGDRHYYLIQSPSFLLEYDNSQSDGNHIHTVWREFAGDWGSDLPGAHTQGELEGLAPSAANPWRQHFNAGAIIST